MLTQGSGVKALKTLHKKRLPITQKEAEWGDSEENDMYLSHGAECNMGKIFRILQ